MRHLACYHNPDRMGYASGKVTRFSVATSKPVEALRGQRVWSISGDAQPRAYHLDATWVVDQVGHARWKEFANFARASEANGYRFRPPIHLNPLPWFRGFLKSQSNFSLGLQSIERKYAAKLDALWMAQRGQAPDTSQHPDDLGSPEKYREGGTLRVMVNTYERDLKAR